ncbi:MAG: arylsulfatase [Verrucomicrobia bacterium]|nr:arylsulfatase [Verrucomicrobiota bacterium]
MNFNRENWLRAARLECALWLLCVFSPPGFAQQPATSQTRPNIVIILADDLGWGDLSCYGQKKFSTPNLDRLAAEGMRFTQAYAGGPGGAASRGALFTGKHTGHARIRGNYGPDGHPVALRGEDTTLTEVLKRAGYHTGVIGKWGLGGDGTSGMPEKKGVDQWLGLIELRHATNQFPAVVARYDPKQLILTNAASYYQPIYENDGGRPARHAQDVFTFAASNYFRIYPAAEFNKFRPFFLHLAFTLPNAGEEPGTNTPVKYLGSAARFAKEKWPAAEQRKAAAIAHIDASVGQLLKQLDDPKLAEHTVVIFTSDNAAQKDGLCNPEFFNSNGPFRGSKGDLTEGGLRVPLLVRWPKRIQPGTTSDQPVALWDLFATAAEFAGVKDAPATDGISLVPALLGQPQKVKRELLYWERHEPQFQQAIRAGDWKGIRAMPDGPLELFHLARDPGEARDVAADYPAIVKHLEALLKSARSESTVWRVDKK